MLPYWFLFSVFAIGSLIGRIRRPGDFRSSLMPLALGVVTALMIGLRLHVGADYETYEIIFRAISHQDLGRALDWGDPGYQSVNWVVAQLGGKIWHVNLVCASIFSWGLVRFCRQQPSPILAMLVAVPYLIIVVAMGYTRQAVAIGFVMAGLASLQRGNSVLMFALYVLGATLFHRTAMIVLPIAIFAGQRSYLLNGVAVIALSYGLYSSFLADDVGNLVRNYIDARYNSQGALIRVVMNVVPAFLVFFLGERMAMDSRELRLWKIISLVALATVPALLLVPSTTAVDRIALYLIPIQIVGIGRAIFLFRSPEAARLVVISYCASVLFIWLNFAQHSRFWIPYRMINPF